MGNVLASSKPPGTDFTAPFGYSQQKEESSKNEKIENPGAMEDLHKKCKGKSEFMCIKLGTKRS